MPGGTLSRIVQSQIGSDCKLVFSISRNGHYQIGSDCMLAFSLSMIGQFHIGSYCKLAFSLCRIGQSQIGSDCMLACSLSRIGQSQIGPGTMLQELRQKTDPEGFTDPNLTQSFIHDIIPWGLFTTSSHRTQLSKVRHLFLHLLCVYVLMSESEVRTHFLK